MVGCLLHLSTGSRPDISHALSVASRNSSLTEARKSALKRILRYLKGSLDVGLCFTKKERLTLEAYSDSDYANDVSRKSTTGCLITLNGTPVSWKSQLQKIISLSTTESEFISGCDTTKRLISIRHLLTELNLINDSPTQIFIDNTSTIKIFTDEKIRQRTKHIDVHSKWLYQAFEEGIYRKYPVKTKKRTFQPRQCRKLVS